MLVLVVFLHSLGIYLHQFLCWLYITYPPAFISFIHQLTHTLSSFQKFSNPQVSFNPTSLRPFLALLLVSIMAESNSESLRSTNSYENNTLVRLPPKKRSYAYMAESESLRSKLLPPKKRYCAYLVSSQLPQTSPTSDQHQVIPIPNDVPVPPPGDDIDKLGSLMDHIRINMKYNDARDFRIIMEDRKLTNTDADDHQTRLSMPVRQILAPFLTKEEELLLQQKVDPYRKAKIDVKVIIESSEYDLQLSRWNYPAKKNIKNSKKKNDNNNEPGWRYALKHGWRHLREEHNLKVDDIIRLVSFRSNERLHIAIAIVKRRSDC